MLHQYVAGLNMDRTNVALFSYYKKPPLPLVLTHYHIELGFSYVCCYCYCCRQRKSVSFSLLWKLHFLHVALWIWAFCLAMFCSYIGVTQVYFPFGVSAAFVDISGSSSSSGGTTIKHGFIACLLLPFLFAEDTCSRQRKWRWKVFQTSHVAICTCYVCVCEDWEN